MNFRQARDKIKSIENVGKITRAMQMVAAAKMKRAQQEALEGRPYREILEMVIRRVVTLTDKQARPFLVDHEAKPTKDLYLLISSNKGLCGSFHFNLIRFLTGQVSFDRDEFIILGKKGADFILKMGGKIIADFSNQLPFIDNVSAIFSSALNNFLQGNYRAVYILYNKFVSTFRLAPTKAQILPLEREDLIPKEKQIEKSAEDQVVGQYLIEPSPKKILAPLAIDFLQEKIRGAILDSEAAEQSARMLAMKNATDSAADLVYNLTLLKNKLRQEKITNELLDMISAKRSTEG